MVTALVHVPRVAKALMGMYAIRKAAFGTGQLTAVTGFLSGSGIVSKALGFLGIATIVDFVIDLFGQNEPDADIISELILDMMESNFVDVANPRSGDDATAVPSILVFDLSGNLNRGRPFLTWEYFSRNFVKAVRKNERTPRYRGRPTPGGRRRRSN